MSYRMASLFSLFAFSIVSGCSSTPDATEYKLSFYPVYEGLTVFKEICIDADSNPKSIAEAAEKYGIKQFTTSEVKGLLSKSTYFIGATADKRVSLKYNERHCEIQYPSTDKVPLNVIDMQLGKILRTKYKTVQEYPRKGPNGSILTNYLRIIDWTKHFFTVTPEGGNYIFIAYH